MDSERVIPYKKYNNYAYYANHKEYYKLNYLEKKRRNAIEEQNKDYYKDYWVNQRWSKENNKEK